MNPTDAKQQPPPRSDVLRGLTGPQRRVLEFVAANSGRLYGGRHDIPASVARHDVFNRVWLACLLDPPRLTETRTWELTAAGRALLQALTPQVEGGE